MIRSTLIALFLMTPALASAQQLPRAEDFLGKKSSLSLHEAVYLALQNNLDLRLARARPAISDEVVQEARGAFDPTLSAEYGFDIVTGRNQEGQSLCPVGRVPSATRRRG